MPEKLDKQLKLEGDVNISEKKTKMAERKYKC